MEMALTARLAHREGFHLTAEALGRGRRGGGLQVGADAHLSSLAAVPVMADPGQPAVDGPAPVAPARIETAPTGVESGPALAPRPAVSAFEPADASGLPTSGGGGTWQRAEGMHRGAVGTRPPMDSGAPRESRGGTGSGWRPSAGRLSVLAQALDAPGAGPQGQDVYAAARAGAGDQGGVGLNAEAVPAPRESVRRAGLPEERLERGRIQGDGFEELLARLARRERLEFAR